MDEPKNMPKLDEVGVLAGAKLIKPEHFPAAFDVT
jgi:hypothetical protein